MALAPNSINVPDLREGGVAHATSIISGKHYPVGMLADDTGNLIGSTNPLSVGGFGATSLGKREDDPHTTLDVGVMALTVRNDTAIARSGANSDYEPIPTGVVSSVVGVLCHIVGDGDKFCRGAQANDTAQVGGPVAIGGIVTSDPINEIGARGIGNVGNISVGEYGEVYIKVASTTGTLTVNTELPATASAGDAAAGSTSAPFVKSMGYAMNASTWDRIRAVVNGLNSTGIGMQAAGVCGQLDDTSPGAVTENQFAPMRMTALRGLHTQPEFSTRSDTYTAAASGTTVDLTSNPLKDFAIQTVATGAVTSWTILLEGSLDGTNFFTILTASNVTPNIASGAAKWPVRYLRSRCSAIVLGGGTNVVATILGTA